MLELGPASILVGGARRAVTAEGHAQRKFFVLADIEGSARRAAQGKALAVLSPICLAVQRIDALFDIERDINGHAADARHVIRQAVSAPLVVELHR